MSLLLNNNTINKVTYNNNVGYTIVGTPTINNNMASDFSENDYLITNASITASEISELVIKIKINSSALGKEEWQGILVSNFFINYYCSTNGFEYAQIYFNGMNELSFTNSYLLPDTYYWLKYTNNGTNATSYISTDGKNYTQIQTKNSNTISVEVPNTITFGNKGSQVFDGIIDFNETYIKVGKTTWFNGKEQTSIDVDYLTLNNGQAGYTIIGSPTINNGRISNTGNGNYISLPSINLFFNSSFEYKASFYIGENVLIGETGYIATMPFIGADGVFRAYGTYFSGGWLTIYCGVSADNTDIDYYTQLTPNTYYSIIWKKENGVLTTSLKVGNNPIQQILSDNGADLTNNPSSTGIAFGGLDMKDGYIDLNNTYIKVNNKYWFNGGSKLIWCDPNIYLQGDGNQLIATDIYPNSNYTLEANIKPIYNSTQYNNSIIDTAGNGDEKGRIGFLYRDEDLSSESAGCIFYNYYPTTVSSWTNYQFNKKYNLKTIKDSENTYFYVNGNLDHTHALETLETSTQPLKFWNDNSKGILYNVKVNDDNGNLVGNFVPVPQGMVVGGGYLAPSNGMFDIVKQKFYPNSGTGTFNIGKD